MITNDDYNKNMHDHEEKRKAIQKAVKEGRIKDFDYLVEHAWAGDPALMTFSGTPKVDFYLLWLAAGNGQTEMLEHILRSHKDYKNHTSRVLFFAVANGHIDTVDRLLKMSKEDFDIPDSLWGDEPLRVAARHGHINLVDHLLKHYPKYKLDARVTDKNSGYEGENLLCAAAECHDPAMLKHVLEIPGNKFKLDEVFHDGKYDLIGIMIIHFNPPANNYFALEDGELWGKKWREKDRKKFATFDYLFNTYSQYFDINRQDNEGSSQYLCLSLGYENGEIFSYLLERGIRLQISPEKRKELENINHTQVYKLFIAAENLLIAVNSEESKDSNDKFEQSLRTLGTAVNGSRKEDGNTPLHIAIQNGSFERIRRLINAGASFDIKNKSSKTAIDLAREQDNPDILTLCLMERMRSYEKSDKARGLSLAQALDHSLKRDKTTPAASVSTVTTATASPPSVTTATTTAAPNAASSTKTATSITPAAVSTATTATTATSAAAITGSDKETLDIKTKQESNLFNNKALQKLSKPIQNIEPITQLEAMKKDREYTLNAFLAVIEKFKKLESQADSIASKKQVFKKRLELTFELGLLLSKGLDRTEPGNEHTWFEPATAYQLLYDAVKDLDRDKSLTLEEKEAFKGALYKKVNRRLFDILNSGFVKLSRSGIDGNIEAVSVKPTDFALLKEDITKKHDEEDTQLRHILLGRQLEHIERTGDEDANDVMMRNGYDYAGFDAMHIKQKDSIIATIVDPLLETISQKDELIKSMNRTITEKDDEIEKLKRELELLKKSAAVSPSLTSTATSGTSSTTRAHSTSSAPEPTLILMGFSANPTTKESDKDSVHGKKTTPASSATTPNNPNTNKQKPPHS